MDTILTDVLSQVTGGLVTDMHTAIVALLGLGVVLVAFDYLKDIFENHLADSRSERAFAGGGELNQLRRKAQSYRGTAAGDLYSYQYKQKIKNYRDPGPGVSGSIGGLSLEDSADDIDLIDWTSEIEDYDNLEMED